MLERLFKVLEQQKPYNYGLKHYKVCKGLKNFNQVFVNRIIQYEDSVSKMSCKD